MKRSLVVLLLIFYFFSPLIAQSAETEAEVLQQYETLSWDPVDDVKGYEVTIEQFDQSSQNWVKYKTIKTKKCEQEVLFTPGIYRVSISSYNFLGRKGKASNWVSFKILEDKIPYLFPDNFTKNKEWNVPVLNLQSNQSENNNQYIQSAAGFAKNTIGLKGKNIFSDSTEVYLVPVEKSVTGGKDFVNFSTARKEVKLGIIKKDSKKNEIVVSYNKTLLQSGYYNLEVRNSIQNKVSVEIMVLTDMPVQIAPGKGFVVDQNYQVNSIQTDSKQELEFSVKGKGFTSQTKFYLQQTEGPYPYPFETGIPNSVVELSVRDYTTDSNGELEVNLYCKGTDFRTDYYDVYAENSSDEKKSFLMLAKKAFDQNYTDDVDRIKSKYNKHSGKVEITIKDDELDSSKTYTLISEYNPITFTNNRIPLDFIRTGNNKLFATVDPSAISFGNYALLIEDANSSNVIFGEIDNSMRISKTASISEEKIEEAFFKPEVEAADVIVSDDDKVIIEFKDNKIVLKKRMPFVFPYMTVPLIFDENSNTSVGFDLDILNFKYIALTGGYRYKVLEDEIAADSALVGLKLCLANDYFAPYIFAGAGHEFVFSPTSTIPLKDSVFLFGQVGAVLFTCVDIGFNVTVNDWKTDSPVYNKSISFAMSFPLQPFKFKRFVETRSATIQKQGLLDVSQYIDPSSNVDELYVNDASILKGLEKYKALETIAIDSTVKVIEKDTFKDCPNLSYVSFNYGYESLVIKKGAFENTKQLKTITLPDRTSVIEKGAFEGLDQTHAIFLSWNKDKDNGRDLSGLYDCNAVVFYADDTPFRRDNLLPIEISDSWPELPSVTVQDRVVEFENKYYKGVRFIGFSDKFNDAGFDLSKASSSKEIINSLKDGKALRFKVDGDGNKYQAVFVTNDKKIKTYKFKTKSDKVTEVEIPLKNIDMNKVDFFGFVPMSKGKYNFVTFFDFEVIGDGKKAKKK